MTIILLLLAGGCVLVSLVLGGRWLESLAWRNSLVAFRLQLPAGLGVDQVAGWLATVSAATHAHRLAMLPSPPLAVELVATSRGIEHYLLVPAGVRGAVESGLRASMPGIRLEQAPSYLSVRKHFGMAAEAALTNQRRPLAVDRAEVASRAVLASLQPLQGNEAVVMQWIVTGAGVPAVPKVVSNTSLPWWLDDTPGDAEAVQAERLKQKAPLLRCVVRVGVQARDSARAYSLFGRAWGTLRTMNASGVGVVRRGWLPAGVVASRMERPAVPLLHWPLTLNSRELAGLLGFAIGDARLPGLALSGARQLPVPPGLASQGAVIGRSNYPGSSDRLVALQRDDRLRHTWIAGPTGAGKSTLLANLIVQDMAAGDGVIVLDARGDLVTDLLDRVPERRRDDVIVLDPSETGLPVGFNVLHLGHGEHARELAVDHVLHIFQDLYRSSWGPRTADVLRAGLLTLTATRAHDGSAFTICELPELLTNGPFRAYVTRQSGLTPGLHSFWRWYEAMSDAERAQVIGPVLNKLRAFVLKAPLRLMLGQSTGVDLSGIFRERRILLVPLSKGTVGSETAALVGSMLVASCWQVALSRVRLPVEKRRPVWLYVDEFQEVVRLPLDLADMLAQARALGLGLTLAHQHLGQLPEAVRTAVSGTARTQVLFQLDHDDARTLSRPFAPLTADDLMGLARYEVAVRPCVDGRTLSPLTLTTLPMPEPTTEGAALATAARQRHGLARAEVEVGLVNRLHTSTDTTELGRGRRT
jgi:type IV secretion system coupling TraD/TrwB family protein